jgi:hypothetical protein
MNSKASSTDFNGIGYDMLSSFDDGLNDKKPDVVDDVRSVIEDLANAISDNEYKVSDACDDVIDDLSNIADHTSGWYDLGMNCCKGLANGLYDYEYTSNDAAWWVGRHALEAAKDAVDSNSPSKEFVQLGKYNDQGLAIGMTKYGYLADKAAYAMSSSVLRIASAVTDSINTQPVISPVLDLSNVQAQAGQLSSLLSTNQSIKMAANVAANATSGVASSTGQGSSTTNYNEFNITNPDPKKTAQEVDKILQKQVARRSAEWA